MTALDAGARPRLVGPILIGASLALISCMGPSTGSQTEGSQARGASPGLKTLRIGFIDEPNDVALIGAGTGGGVANREHAAIFQAGLTRFDAQGNLHPGLAAKVPALADGDWKTFPDGKMEVTWQLRPNARWHDGTPLAAEDFVFGIRLLVDDALPNNPPRWLRQVSEALASDPHTLVLRFKEVYAQANVSGPGDIPAVPRHLLSDLYQQVDKQAFINSPYWTSEYVGLGPFKLVTRVLGSQIEAAAFDDYVLGRPKIDRLIIRYIFDVNALFTNLLSGDVEITPPGSLEPVNAIDLKRQWESNGAGTVVPITSRLRQVQLQRRDPNLPWARDVRVRQAMVHLMDRQALVDTVLFGLTTVGDVPVLRGEPLYGLLERRGLAKYPYDRGQGERLLEAGGWSRGSDGSRRSAAGESFAYTQAITGRPDLPEALVVVDGLKAGGIDATVDIIDDLAANTNELRANARGGITRSARLEAVSYAERFLSTTIPSEQTRWRGANTGGYVNPAVDRVYEQYVIAIDPTVRAERFADMLKLLWDDVAYLPLFYGVDILAYRKGLQGPAAYHPSTGIVSWNIHAWETS